MTEFICCGFLQFKGYMLFSSTKERERERMNEFTVSSVLRTLVRNRERERETKS